MGNNQSDLKEKKNLMKIVVNENEIQVNGETSLLRIQFDMNEIIIGKEDGEHIDFMKDWIEHPEEFKEYKIKVSRKRI